ncbi:MAG: hypothetical protein ACFFG0_02160 [Candidatus Thorarchaeota archaeon]
MILETILGGVTGLLGNVLTGFLNYKTQKLKNEHDLAMVKAESEAMRLEAQMQIQVTKAEIEGAVELADSQAYMESQKSASKSMFSEKWIDKLFSVKGKFGRFFSIPVAVFIAMGFAFIDWLRGFMRPALTLYLTGVTSVLTYMAWKILQSHGIGMSSDDAISTYTQVTSIVNYLTVSCITWWFGDRRMSKFLTTLNDKKKQDTSFDIM